MGGAQTDNWQVRRLAVVDVQRGGSRIISRSRARRVIWRVLRLRAVLRGGLLQGRSMWRWLMGMRVLSGVHSDVSSCL